jgi:hypothetical protein
VTACGARICVPRDWDCVAASTIRMMVLLHLVGEADAESRANEHETVWLRHNVRSAASGPGSAAPLQNPARKDFAQLTC